MFRLNKNRSIIHSLRDRETNSISEPYRKSLNIIAQLIRSENRHFKSSWCSTPRKHVSYECGLMYFDDFSSIYSVYGRDCKPTLTYKLKPLSAKTKVIDIISYIKPVFNKFENCECELSHCTCISRSILCLTSDNWLCQYNSKTGTLMTEVYVHRVNSNFNFKYCDWDKYAERVVLTSQLNPSSKQHSSKSDVVVNLAVFKVFPLEFTALMEIKRSVFGATCKHVNVDEELLILGMNYSQVHIYNFSEVLAQGSLTPYKIGQQYGDIGKVGMHPMGLPLNFEIQVAPPLLFNVHCFGQSLCFGGFPFHCMYPDPKYHFHFSIRNISDDSLIEETIQSDLWNDEEDIVRFHPDGSNRILVRELGKVCVYNLTVLNETSMLKKSFCMEFPSTVEPPQPRYSPYERRLVSTVNKPVLPLHDRCIMALDYEDELELFGILGTSKTDKSQMGYIKLYDSFTGDEVKTIDLEHRIWEDNYYKLDMDRDVLIVTQKDLVAGFKIYVYYLAECLMNDNV